MQTHVAEYGAGDGAGTHARMGIEPPWPAPMETQERPISLQRTSGERKIKVSNKEGWFVERKIREKRTVWAFL